MQANDLIAKYNAFHSYAHARKLAASGADDVCFVPGPQSARPAVPRTENAGSAENMAGSVCYVP